MKIICTCGAEIQLYNLENVVLEVDKYQRLVFPSVECSKCGKKYNISMELEHVGTNPKMIKTEVE